MRMPIATIDPPCPSLPPVQVAKKGLEKQMLVMAIIELLGNNNTDCDFDDGYCYRRTCVDTPKRAIAYVIAHVTAIKMSHVSGTARPLRGCRRLQTHQQYKNGASTLEEVSDANWGNIPDYGRSTSAYIIMLAGAQVSFNVVALDICLRTKSPHPVLARNHKSYRARSVPTPETSRPSSNASPVVSNKAAASVADGHTKELENDCVACRILLETPPFYLSEAGSLVMNTYVYLLCTEISRRIRGIVVGK